MNYSHLSAGSHSVSSILHPDSLEEACVPHPVDISVVRDILFLEIKFLVIGE